MDDRIRQLAARHGWENDAVEALLGEDDEARAALGLSPSRTQAIRDFLEAAITSDPDALELLKTLN